VAFFVSQFAWLSYYVCNFFVYAFAGSASRTCTISLRRLFAFVHSLFHASTRSPLFTGATRRAMYAGARWPAVYVTAFSVFTRLSRLLPTEVDALAVRNSSNRSAGCLVSLSIPRSSIPRSSLQRSALPLLTAGKEFRVIEIPKLLRKMYFPTVTVLSLM